MAAGGTPRFRCPAVSAAGFTGPGEMALSVPLVLKPALAYSLPMKRIKTWDELTFQDNYLFQKVMRKETNLLLRLLERLLGFAIRKIDFPLHLPQPL